MVLKNLGLALALWSMIVVPAAASAQAGGAATPAHPASPSAAPAATPSDLNPAASCQGGNCDQPQPHITIATPAPAPAPWPVQDRISWAANLLLLLIAYVGILLAISALRKIERQTRYIESVAQSAADSAKAALMYAEAQAQAQRPWLVVSVETEPGPEDRFTVVGTNRGRSPLRIVTQVDDTIIAPDEAQLPQAPSFRSEPHPPRIPVILLPGESTDLKSFSRDEVKTIFESPDDLRRVESWEAKIYLYGLVTYIDLRAPADKPPYETGWCCWYIHGHQKSGMVRTGPVEYNRHT